MCLLRETFNLIGGARVYGVYHVEERSWGRLLAFSTVLAGLEHVVSQRHYLKLLLAFFTILVHPRFKDPLSCHHQSIGPCHLDSDRIRRLYEQFLSENKFDTLGLLLASVNSMLC